MMGLMVADAGTAGAAQFILQLAQMLTPSGREEATALLKELADMMHATRHAIDELKKAEEKLRHHEASLTGRQKILVEAETKLEAERATHADAVKRFTEERDAFNALRAEIRASVREKLAA
jgi:predicted  nucleic acid-binding Zn-ribbon protein